LVPSGVVSKALYLGGKVFPLVFNYHGSFGSSLPSQGITVFTDGSASLPPLLAPPPSSARALVPSSSWGLCYGNDWFHECYHTVPSEDQMSVRAVRGSLLVGDRIADEFTHGIYMAELHAVVRALISLPVTWKVKLVLDSQSSITAIDKFLRRTISARSKLRMPGRPMLGLVAMLVKDRQEHGGSVSWIHVKSHSNDVDQHAVGNRCADFIAGSSRIASEPALEALRLELGERWLYVTDVRGCVLYDDLRRSALVRAKEVNLTLWRESSSQHAFADIAVLDLCSQLLTNDTVFAADPAKVKFLLLVTSNTLQYVWIDSADAGEKVQQRCCSACSSDVVLDVNHVFACPSTVSERDSWCDGVIEYLKPHVPESSFTSLLRTVSWNELVAFLFNVSEPLTLLRLMFGGFSDYDAYLMLSRLHVLNRGAVKSLTLELRKQMFVQCYVLWQSLC
jgi:ribonuclease HI